MENINASDAKREFGELLLKAQQAPVGISRNGKPVAVMVSVDQYQQLESFREERLKAMLESGIAELAEGKVRDGRAVIKKLRDIADG